MKVIKYEGFKGVVIWRNEHNQIHREDGPAIEYITGNNSWYLYGRKYNEAQWQKEVLKLKLKRLSEL